MPVDFARRSRPSTRLIAMPLLMMTFDIAYSRAICAKMTMVPSVEADGSRVERREKDERAAGAWRKSGSVVQRRKRKR